MQATQDIKEIIATLFKVSVGDIDAYIEARQAEARRRVARANERYAAALTHMTDVQTVLVEQLQQGGAKMNSRIWQDRNTGNIAVMMVQEKWDSMKGRMGKKLTMVYPDGSRSETFEKTISIKKSF